MNEIIFSKQLRVIITTDVTRHHHIQLIIERAKEVRSNVYHLRLTDPSRGWAFCDLWKSYFDDNF